MQIQPPDPISPPDLSTPPSNSIEPEPMNDFSAISQSNRDLDQNVTKMFEFLEEWYKMDLSPLRDISIDSRIRWCKLSNQSVEGLPGILVGDEIEDASCWLSIERLHPIPPPSVPDVLQAWTDPEEDPGKEPRIATSIEVVDQDATDALWENFRNEEARRSSLPDEEQEDLEPLITPTNVVVEVCLDESPDVSRAWESYLETWQEWATEERPRRKTIALYQDLFSYRQQLDAGTSSNPQEMVWGVGMTYRSGEERLRFPLLSIPVEFVGSPDSLTIKIAGLDRPAICNIHALLEEFPEGATAFEQNIRVQLEPDPERPGLSPFDTDRLRKILDVDAGQIDSSTTFADTPPPRTDCVTFTLDWVIMIQTRSSNYMLQDVQRMKHVAEGQGVAPCALEDIAIRRETPYPESSDVFRGFSHIEQTEKQSGGVRELYFPKPYNHEQVEVIRKLEGSEGVVLQGPPGTGKTHTIANVISHYLATGKRVLVTSQKTPALKVLKSQLPEGIQMLTGLLLESDRDGQAELESSINRITSEILHYSQAALSDEIRELETSIDRLHIELALNEKKTAELARQYRTMPPTHIGCESPRELAEEVAQAASSYSWFVDDLDAELGWKDGPVDEAFFDDLRSARKHAGAHLHVDPGMILDPECLPTIETFLNLHKALCSYSRCRESLNRLSRNHARQYLDLSQREHAGKVLGDLESLKDSLVAAHGGTWQHLAAYCYHAPDRLPDDLQGIEHIIRESLEACLELHQRNDLETKSYALKPIHLPHEGGPLNELLSRVTMASKGGKPFGLAERVSARHLIRAFHSITIRDLPPADPEEWSDVKRWIELHLEGNRLAKDWNFLAAKLSIPPVADNAGVEIYSQLRSTFGQLRSIRNLSMELLAHRLSETHQLLNLGNRPESLPSQILADPEILEPILEALRLLIGEFDGREATRAKQEVLDLLDGNPNYLDQFELVRSRLGSPESSTEGLEEEWRAALRDVAVLHSKAPVLRQIASAADVLRARGGNKLAAAITGIEHDEEDADAPILPKDIGNAWKWASRKAYLRRIDSKSRLLNLNTERLHKEKKLATHYEDLAVKHTWRKLKETFQAKPSLVAALNQFVNHIKKIGKGTGALAPFHRTQAQKALVNADEAIRCWIMPQWRISESLPSSFGLFDLVIIDEASQSDLKALPAIARGKKVLVVGDDKQVSPLQVGTRNESVMGLYNRFLKDLPFGDSMTIKDSIYNLASIAYGAASIRLREHFRCVEPIINFSSKHFYDGEIRCLRVPKATERMNPVLIDVYLECGVRSDSKKTNCVEADYIVDEIARLVEDPNFGDRAIGVITLLGNDQSRYIWEKVQNKIPEEKILQHDIRCGDSSTFQGSEFDVVFLSMVDHHPKRSLTTIGFEQRYNVAASRAKDRMYLCRSVSLDALETSDLRHKLITHFSDPGLRLSGKGRDDCESPFEEEIFDYLVGEGFTVSTQVAAAGFRIDMVVEDASGRRLAIECDGYLAHPEHKWAEDMSRQRMLERAGWTFHRIWGPSYYCDRDSTKRDLIEAIERHGIEKHCDGIAAAVGIVEFRHVRGEGEVESGYGQEFTVDSAAQSEQEEYTQNGSGFPQKEVENSPRNSHSTPTTPLPSTRPEKVTQAVLDGVLGHGPLFESQTNGSTEPVDHQVEIGDTVTLRFDDDDEILRFTIVRGKTSWERFRLSHQAPLAQTLLGQPMTLEPDSGLRIQGRKFQVLRLKKRGE